MQQIFLEVQAELDYAAKKWGTKFDAKNTPNDWIAYIIQYLGAAVTHPWDHMVFRQMLIKTIGLCVSAIIWCDKTNGNMPERHYD